MQIGQLEACRTNWKRAKTRLSFVLTAHNFERTKTDVLMHRKQRLAKLQLKAESEDVLKGLCPHIGHHDGAWRKKSKIAGKEPALTKAQRELLAAEQLGAEKCLDGFWELKDGQLDAFLMKNKASWRKKAGNWLLTSLHQQPACS